MMTKTYQHLWHQITNWENLLKAYQKCRKRKRYKIPAVVFDYAWETNLLELQQDLISGKYKPGPYRHFYITDPKPRKISAASFRDRVLHHALVNVLEPLYERRFIYDSYACRKEKGTHRAIKRAQIYLRRYPWCLKTDIIRFFPNIDHEILKNHLAKTICDEETQNLIDIILQSGEGILKSECSHHCFPGDDLFSQLRPRGLPIGNLTSQFFANVFLDPIDHFIKEELRVPGYIRYADDFLLFGRSRKELWSCYEAVSQQLSKIRLKLHSDKTHVSPSHCGVSFLGFRLFPNGKRLNQQTIRRINKKIRQMRWEKKNGKIDYSQIQVSLKSWLAHAMIANSTGIRRDLWSHLYF